MICTCDNCHSGYDLKDGEYKRRNQKKFPGKVKAYCDECKKHQFFTIGIGTAIKIITN